MAAFADVERSSTSSPFNRTHGQRPPITKRQLPDGACNFRDLSSGPAALSCGCKQFWSKITSQESRDGSRYGDLKRDGDAWCCCGHHACYHEFMRSCTRTRSVQDNGDGETSVKRHDQDMGQSLYIQVVKATADGRFQLVTDAQPSVTKDFQSGRSYRASPNSRASNCEAEPPVNAAKRSSAVPLSTDAPPTRIRGGRPQQSGQRLLHNGRVTKDTAPDAPATPSPRAPSKRHPSSTGTRSATKGGQFPTSPSSNVCGIQGAEPYMAPMGLGLNMLSKGLSKEHCGEEPDRARIRENVHMHERSTEGRLIEAALSASDVASTIAAGPGTSPSRVFLQHVSQHRQTAPAIDVSCLQYPGYLGEDLMQSATEVATPSNAGTPDLRALDHSVHGAKQSVDKLLQDVVNNIRVQSTDDKTSFLTPSGNRLRIGNLPPEAIAGTSVPAAGIAGTSDPSGTALLLKQASLEHISPYLTSIRQQLASLPNLSTALQLFSNRLDALENASMSFGPVEDLQEKFELYDGRLVDVESRLADHEQYHAALDPDLGPIDKRWIRGTNGLTNANVSFGSNCSAHSTTSSALLAAALGRAETNARFEDVEQRLADLEKLAPPSVTHPWAIEIILLPWGHDMKGIWLPSDDIGSENSALISEGSDAWTQAWQSRNSHSMGSARHGWNVETIQNWADASTQWLSARACGTKSVVYERLRSRGLVRDISLTGLSARTLYSAVTSAFGKTLEAINNWHTGPSDCNQTYKAPNSAAYLGLNAQFVPLRKVHKSSRLRFLDPSELATPALWTADFLGSGVIMRALGGQKRLFITTPAAYLQHQSADSEGWTWQRLREMPRVHLSGEITDLSSGPHVGEADAKEPCWGYDPRLDPPMSVHTSFYSNASHASFHGSGRNSSPQPAFGGSAHDVTTARKLSPNSHPPITPTSELPPGPRPRSHRTTSMPAVRPVDIDMHLQPKRAVASFEHLHPESAAPDLLTEAKRRRFSHTPETEVHPDGMWTSLTPRRSREPPSPFQSSRARSQFTAEVVHEIPESRKRRVPTPSAYATPHSGTVVKMDLGSGGLGTHKSLYTASDDKGEEDGDVWEGVGDEDEREHGNEQNLSGTEEDMEDDYDDEYDDDMEDVR